MGKKMKLLQWPSCNHPKTLSYRFNSDDVIKTVNSVFFDPNDAITAAAAVVETPESWFTNSSESASFSTESDDFVDGESLETVVAGARSERRLFFEPGGCTSSIIAEKTFISAGEVDGSSTADLAGGCRKLGESVALALESDDPYGDFRRSMAEMVEINGVREWEGLEELLGWYLRMNGKDNHGFIVGAFVDLLVELSNSTDSGGACDDSSTTTAAATAAMTTDSFSSAMSRFSSPSERGRSEIDEEDRNLTR